MICLFVWFTKIFMSEKNETYYKAMNQIYWDNLTNFKTEYKEKQEQRPTINLQIKTT